MKLTSEQVKKVAKLANLPISDEEVEKYTDQLSQILEYIDLLNKLDTTNVEPTFNVTGAKNVLMSDTSLECLPQEDALQNGPNTKNGFFVTKGVFENE